MVPTPARTHIPIHFLPHRHPGLSSVGSERRRTPRASRTRRSAEAPRAPARGLGGHRGRLPRRGHHPPPGRRGQAAPAGVGPGHRHFRGHGRLPGGPARGGGRGTGPPGLALPRRRHGRGHRAAQRGERQRPFRQPRGHRGRRLPAGPLGRDRRLAGHRDRRPAGRHPGGAVPGPGGRGARRLPGGAQPGRLLEGHRRQDGLPHGHVVPDRGPDRRPPPRPGRGLHRFRALLRHDLPGARRHPRRDRDRGRAGQAGRTGPGRGDLHPAGAAGPGRPRGRAASSARCWDSPSGRPSGTRPGPSWPSPGPSGIRPRWLGATPSRRPWPQGQARPPGWPSA